MSSPSDLRVTLVQTAVHWHSIEANLAMLEEKLWQLDGPTDLVVLPEMFTTGFTNEATTLAEPMNSRTFRWMRQMAAQLQAVVTGSYIVRDGKAYYNRLLWMEPDGRFVTYDKRHLFRRSDEHSVYTPGEERPVFTWKGWNIKPLICYDLRFPVWCRNQVTNTGALAYDALLCVANWPAVRSDAWMTLLRARAIENQSYILGVNRVGADGNRVNYDGNSVVMNAEGDILERRVDEEDLLSVTLSYEELREQRKRFPVHLDADQFSLGR